MQPSLLGLPPVFFPASSLHVLPRTIWLELQTYVPICRQSPAPAPVPSHSLFSLHRSLPMLFPPPKCPFHPSPSVGESRSCFRAVFQYLSYKTQLPDSPGGLGGWAGCLGPNIHPLTRLLAPIQLGTWLSLLVQAHQS